MATNHNFRVKNGLEVAGTVIADSSGVLQLPSTLTASTQSAGTANTTLATTAFVTTAIANVGAHIDWTGASAGTIHASNYTNTTYSVGDGGLSQISFTTADNSKLDAIEASATADQTDAEIRTAVEAATDSNVFTDADHTKLNAVEASADVTDTTNVVAALTAGTNVTISAGGTIASTDTNTTYSVGDGGLTTNDFTNADHTKLNAIEASATADQSNAEIRAAVEAATDSNVFADADHTKLNAIEASATADQTAAEVRTLVGSASDSNVFSDSDLSKLTAIEASADVTDSTNVVAALTAGTAITISAGGTIASTDTTYTSSDFTHDSLTGFVANEHIDWTGSSAGTIHLTNLPATAITTVQTAASQVAMLALTAQEGDVVVRSDESKTYMHNGGTASSMADFTLLSTPTDAVSSVDGATGVITLNHDNLTGFVANEHIDWSADQGSTNIHAGNYTDTNTTYSVGAGGLTQQNFTTTLKSKLDAIEASATADQTNAEIRAAVEAATDSNVFADADHTKLNAIEASATADQTDAQIRTAVEAATDSNVFTDADHTKLNAVEASADVTDTTNVVAALTAGTNVTISAGGTIASTDTNTTYSVGDGGLTTNDFTNADHTKLDGIATGATDNTVASAALPKAGGNMTGNLQMGGTTVVSTARAITGASFTDGYVTWTAAQINRYGAAIELQHTPTNSATLVKIGAGGSNPTVFNAYTGVVAFASTITAAGKDVGTQTVTATAPTTASGFPNGHIWYVV